MRWVEAGQSIAAAARTLCVVEQTLFNGVKAKRLGKLKGADSKPVSAEQIEISRLRLAAGRAGALQEGARHPGKSDSRLRRVLSLDQIEVRLHQSSPGVRVIRRSSWLYALNFVYST